MVLTDEFLNVGNVGPSGSLGSGPGEDLALLADLFETISPMSLRRPGCYDLARFV